MTNGNVVLTLKGGDNSMFIFMGVGDREEVVVTRKPLEIVIMIFCQIVIQVPKF